MNPEITVLMSVYNGEKHLEEAIESILNQNFENFELLIINDASTDLSREIILAYNDPRIRLIDNEQNIGLTRSLNKGLRKAKGKYIARIDSDDIALPKRLYIQYEFLEKRNDVFLVGTGAYDVDENGLVIECHRPLTDIEDIKKTLYIHNCLCHPSIMFRNEGYRYREKFVYAQDYDFYLNLLSSDKKLGNISAPLVKYRINPNGASSLNKTKQTLFALKAKEFYHQRLKYGVDKYDEFVHSEIIDINVEESTDKVILRSEILSNYLSNDFVRARELCKKYIKHNGKSPKIYGFYILTFCGRSGRRVARLIKKVMFSYFLRH